MAAGTPVRAGSLAVRQGPAEGQALLDGAIEQVGRKLS
jgi:hypothetical protein